MTIETRIPSSTSTVAVSDDYASFFESRYAEAAGDASRIPWADGHANPALVNWLNAAAPSLVRCGARVAVPGCGLGEDARELIKRGYEVTAFDVSPTAVEWARRLDPDHAECYHQADLFNLSPRWRRRFDLVAEIYTAQSLPIHRRTDVFKALADLLTPHGVLLVIARGSKEPVSETDGPPWAFTREELLRAVAAAGLSPQGSVDMFLDDDETPPPWRLRGVFSRTRA